MKCPRCATPLRRVAVEIEGAKNKAMSLQCPQCDYFEFEQASSQKVLEELRETPLKIHQKVIKLSQDRLGMYFCKDIIKSLKLRAGEDIRISVPDSKHILLEID